MAEDEEEEIPKDEEELIRIEEASSTNIVKDMDTMNLSVERRNLIWINQEPIMLKNL